MAFKELISTVVVGASGAASISFTSIPPTYADLQIVLSCRTSVAAIGASTYMSINGTSSGYTHKRLYGNGASAFSNSDTVINYSNDINGGNTTASTFVNTQIYIPNYSGNANKAYSIDTALENNATTGYQMMTSGLWSNTSPITSLTFTIESSGTFSQYSVVSLYGIRRGSDGITTPSTTGGIITTSGGYTYHTFLNSGTFSPVKPLTVEALVVAGGGGGAGGAGGGGGGAGGYQIVTGKTVSKGSYSVVIGAGGTNGTGSVVAGNGGDSSFLDIVSFGGAGGGQTDGTGRNGGSGSGNGSFHAGGGLGTAGQGNNGGDAGAGSPYNGGGGGGAGAVGSGMNGGIGSNSASTWATATSTGASGYYAGGGGGGTYYSGNSVGSGGTGGGGGGTSSNGSATSGTANTGGGGGGSGNQYNNGQGSTGGSGIVIIRYPTP